MSTISDARATAAVVDVSERRLVPMPVSSVADRNDFGPALLEGDEAARVRIRVEAYSAAVVKARGRSAP